MALATKESQEIDLKMSKKIEQLLNDHDNIYAHTMTSLEKRLDDKAGLMMRKCDEILSSSNREKRHAPMEDSRQTNDGGGARSYAGAESRSRTSFESNHNERPRAETSRADQTKPAPPESEAMSVAQSPTLPQFRSRPDLTTVSQDTTINASMFEPLNRYLETFITKLSKSSEREERPRRTLKKPKSIKDKSDCCIDNWIMR